MEQKQVETTKNIDETKSLKEKKTKKQDITVKANKKGRHIMRLLNFLRVLIIPAYWCLKPFRFYGNRKVKDGACVFIGNHYTTLDPVYPAAMTWEGIHYVAKRELFSKPILGGIFRRVKAISANRDGNDARVMMDCLKCLKNGEKIALYPEGTRNKTDQDFLPFHHGAAAMAIKAKAPIVPIVLYKKPRFFRLTHVLVGDPIELTEYYDKKLTADDMKAADETLRQRMIQMKKEHTEFLQNKKKVKKSN